MLINFTKMHGLGNDFMVVDNTAGHIHFTTTQIIALADRHFGIGFDQLLLVESSHTPDIDFRYLIYNANGIEVEQCGNGARCFAHFVREQGLSSANPIKVESRAGVISLLINDDNSVQVDMGKPSFKPNDIGLLFSKAKQYQIEGFEWGAVSMGNPHLLRIVDDLDIDITPIAKTIQHSKLLKNSANISFIQIINQQAINLRVYERGVGETLACGSAAAAAVAYGVSIGLLDTTVVVHLNGGDALIEYANDTIFLSGPAEFVFTGQVEI